VGSLDAFRGAADSPLLQMQPKMPSAALTMGLKVLLEREIRFKIEKGQILVE
jgi:hypothetical protein